MATIVISANTSWYLYNFRKNTILSLVDCGHKVIVLAPFDLYSEKLILLGAEFKHIYIDQGGTNPFSDLRTLMGFYRFYSTRKVDVVLNFTPKNNIYSTLASCFFDIKVINNIAGLGIVFVNDNFTSKIVRFLYKFSQRRANKIFFQNEEDRLLFVNNDFASINITERLPGSGVDLSRFTVTPAPNDGITRFLLIARMLYDKGIGYYVDAARILKKKYGESVEFNLLGFLDVNNPSAITTEQMQEWVDENIINYLGVSDSVENELARVDCFVLPSYYREGVPKSLLEAGAMGKPIITTDNVGCRETVEHGFNGFLCDTRSVSSLTTALEKMILMSYEQRIQMGLNSRNKIESDFDEKIVISKYLFTIDSLIEG